MKFSNDKILITGGGTGTGYAMAERFINENNKVSHPWQVVLWNLYSNG